MTVKSRGGGSSRLSMRTRIGVVGAGAVSAEYLANFRTFDDLEVVWVADRNVERARAQAESFCVPRFGDVDALLADSDVDIVVNLTSPASHADIALRSLQAGKHVYSEKPFTTDRESAKRVIAAADGAGLRAGGAPDTMLGATLRHARSLIEEGAIGRPISATAVFESPGPEIWHPSPAFLYRADGGPLMDMGPYFLGALTALLGPIDEVSAVGRRSSTERTIASGPRAGESVGVEVATTVEANYGFASPVRAEMRLSFDASERRSGVSIRGSEGTVHIDEPSRFGSDVRLSRTGAADRALTFPDRACRGIGVADMARAIRGGRAEQASGRRAFHLMDSLIATREAMERGTTIPIRSDLTALSVP